MCFFLAFMHDIFYNFQRYRAKIFTQCRPDLSVDIIIAGFLYMVWSFRKIMFSSRNLGLIYKLNRKQDFSGRPDHEQNSATTIS